MAVVAAVLLLLMFPFSAGVVQLKHDVEGSNVMAMKESPTEMRRAPSPNPNSANLAAMGNQSLEGFVAWQLEQWEQVQKANQTWAERIQSEVKLASEFSSKLTAVRSLPEVATVCQEWTNRHLEMATEDANRMVENGRKMVEAGTRLLTKGWQSNTNGGST